MKLKNSSLSPLPPFLIIITFILPILVLVSSQTCPKTCGQLPLKYPIGAASGCGGSRFSPYIACTDDHLTFTSHTGSYTVTSIDYTNQIIYITDPTMSTCTCSRPSKGFGLDWDAPFSFHDSTIFALLDCEGSGSNDTSTMCDSEGGAVCSLLYSCEAISKLSLPITTCCVYTPVDLGPSFEMDLRKLNCGSYSAVYGFNGQESNPTGWKYGIAIKYKFNYDNEYPTLCGACEKSGGVCGYESGSGETFTCNCADGLNTTTDCFYRGTWSYGSRFLPWKAEALSLFAFTWFVMMAFV